MFSGREEDFYVWTKKVENYVSGVFPKVRGALTFAVESQDAIAATQLLEAETSAEIRRTALRGVVSPHRR